RRGGSKQPLKGQRTKRPKAVKAPTEHASDLQEQLDRRTRELDEVLQQQSATSEVLRVISRSPTELQSVLDMVGENAARLCDANNAVIFRLEGNVLRQVASYGGIPTTSHPSEGIPVNRDRVTGRTVCDRQTIHVHDLASENREYPEGSKDAKRDGHRTTLATPLLREGVPIGAILIRRMKVRPFSDKQIALLETFATQTVIAIENARLLNERHRRTGDRSEAPEQHTATSEVLRVISNCPRKLEPVFDAMLENGTRICGTKFGNLFLREGDGYRAVVVHGSPTYTEYWRREPFASLRDAPLLDRVTRTKQLLHIADLRLDQSYLNRNPRIVALVDIAEARTFLSVPMLKEHDIVGTITMYRTEMRPFTDK